MVSIMGENTLSKDSTGQELIELSSILRILCDKGKRDCFTSHFNVIFISVFIIYWGEETLVPFGLLKRAARTVWYKGLFQVLLIVV